MADHPPLALVSSVALPIDPSVDTAEPWLNLPGIAAVERDTGISKDTLRVWERRYGFPSPLRDATGERVYPAAQVQRLRMLKRLLDTGHRPGRVVPLRSDEPVEASAFGVTGLPALPPLAERKPVVPPGFEPAVSGLVSFACCDRFAAGFATGVAAARLASFCPGGGGAIDYAGGRAVDAWRAGSV